MTPALQLVTGALILNDQNQIWVQQRTKTRVLFPGGWDLAGGHAEVGETPFQSLTREIKEETGWQLTEVTTLVHSVEWQPSHLPNQLLRREYDFLVKVSGDLQSPQLETEKADKHTWVDRTNLELLKENRPDTDQFVFSIVSKAFVVLEQLKKSSLPLLVSGKVVPGERVGRTIGFPTANLDTRLTAQELIPGVYAGYCFVGSEKKPVSALIYFGPRLIFGELTNNFEVHLLNFSADIYATNLSVSVEYFIRKPLPFSTLDDLKIALETDLTEAKLYFAFKETFGSEQNKL